MLATVAACSSDAGNEPTIPDETDTADGGDAGSNADATTSDGGGDGSVTDAALTDASHKDVGDAGVDAAHDAGTCATTTCGANATCSQTDAGPSCDCDPGYAGDGGTCANINDCSGSPCMNGGACTDGVNSYTCDCTGTGFSGNNCETNIDDCASNPCQNGGSCIDGVNSYTCDCTGTGFNGTTCDNNIDDCASNPCQNGGSCTDGVNSYTCGCIGGYSGTNCDVLGTGSDGALSVTSPTTIDTIASGVSGTASSGATTITISTPGSFQIGQVILIHQSEGTGAGNWERNAIISINNGDLNLSSPLAHDYSSSGSDRAQVIVIPQYTDVTESGGGSLTAPAWDGTTGGILVFDATGNVSLDDANGIDMSGKGYLGGVGNNSDPGTVTFKTPGESYPGVGVSGSTTNVANASGGNGGSKKYGCEGGGGGGGGYGTVGGAGGTSASCGGIILGGVGGDVVGDANLTQIFFGSGGGSGGYTANSALGHGGNGGGIVIVHGGQITISTAGGINANGQAGTTEYGDYGGGGGGSGGAVYLGHSSTLTGLANVSVDGGSGGGTNTGGQPQTGGAGGTGRVAAVP